MLNRFCALSIALALLMAFGCGGGPGAGSIGGPTGVANPPFEGSAPEDAYVFKGTPGTYGGMMVMSLTQDPKSFNPITSSETSTTFILMGPVYVPLLGFDNIAQKVDNGLTLSYESTPDFLEWTFKLRKGIMWSDGHPFTADDVKFTFDTSFAAGVETSIKSMFVQKDESYPTVEVVDDYTVKFKLKEINAIFLDSIGSTYLIPKHKWESAVKAGKFQQALGLDTKPEDVIGLGPYRIKELVSQQRVVLERNPYYWKVDTKGQRLPYIDRVIFKIDPDLNTVLLSFQAGQTDMMYQVRSEEFDTLKRQEAEKDFTVTDLGSGFNIIYLMVNQHTGKNDKGKPYVNPTLSTWFTNPKFRQALSYGIDREGIIKTVYNGLAEPIYSFTPPANKVWYNDEVVTKYPFDPEKSKAMLKELGLEDRDGDGIAEDTKGNKLEFRLMTNSENPTRKKVCTYLVDNLKRIGVKVAFQDIPFNSMVTAVQDTHDWDAVLGGWSSANPPDPILMKNIVLSSGLLHYSYPQQKTPATEWEKQIDEAMARNGSTLDLAERKKAFDEVSRLWSANLPEIDILASNYFVAAKNRFGNFKPSPLPLFTYWNIEELYLTK